MAKKNYAPKSPSATDNPLAALSGLGDLPPGPEGSSRQETAHGADAGAVKSDPLRVLVDRKYRRGKAATIVAGFTGSEEALQVLGKTLKVSCGVGGSVKNGEVIIQGDQRERIVALLLEMGYGNTKKSGG